MKLQQKLKKYRERGSTLIEITLVMAIVAVFIAGSVAYYQSASSKNKTRIAIEQLAAVQGAVDSIVTSTGGVVTAALMYASKDVPSSMKGVTAGTFVTPWGTATTIAAATGGGFTVAYAGVPMGACQMMAARDLGDGLVSLSVGSTAGRPGPTLVAACLDAGIVMTWTFR